MIKYLIWIPLVVLYYAYYAYLSNKHNLSPTFFSSVKLYLIGGLVQLWVFVSAVSTNIVFDAILYDLIMVVTQIIVLVILSGNSFTVQQALGLILAITGLLLIR